MNKLYVSIAMLWLLLAGIPPATAQNSPNCTTVSANDYLTGRAFFNYGSVSNAFNTKMRVNVTVGQPVVGTLLGQKHKGALGFWSRFLMPPGPPTVVASEGDLEDRIQVDWNPDPLSPAASSYKIYRNGTLLASVDGETYSFIDFNVIAGKFYTYSVSGVNAFGEGSRNSSLGFLNPNGVVTGQVKTFSGNPVPGAIVTLSPTLGTSMRFDSNSMAFAEYNPVFPRSAFTLSAWVKIGEDNDNTSVFDMGSTIGKNWWLHTLPGGEKGVRFGIGRAAGDVTELDYAFSPEQGATWHYVATTYNGASLLLYVDGELVATQAATIQADSMPLFFGQKPDGTGFYKGSVDEVRFFNRQLAQTEIQMYMNQTVSVNTEGLVAYWKFDEGVGSKAFDITENKSRIYFCGAKWNSDKPNVVNAGITDETGYYQIEGINYGAGTTFTARPSKDFFFNQSLEFNAVNEEYADLTSFALSDSATITVTAKAFDFSGNQTILHKADASGNNQWRLSMETGILKLTIGAESHSWGELGMGFHYLVFTLRKEGSNLAVEAFKDGTSIGTHTFPAVSWDGLPWKLGAQATSASEHSAYFTGLIDEVAFFNILLELPQIQEYANIGTKVTNSNLSSYFNLNEGVDSLLHDMGFALTGNGIRQGAGWSTVAAITRTLPHQFTPSTKLATLNPSNTSVDQVDFTDQSTIPVSGYVRYEGTDCFVAGAEILVNGKRNTPAVFTDETGYFSIDLEPGATVQLSPTYNGHTFYPAFWEIIKASTPVAGILFRDQIKRTVTGQMAGNEICRKSVIPENAIVKVKVESLDGCYSKVLQLTETNGKYQFKNLPPIPMTVAVTEHSNNIIYNYFQLQGGVNIDLTNENDTVDFIYYAPPEIELSPLDTNLCGDPMLEQSAKYSMDIKVYQPYTGGNCYLDSADLTIVNDIQGISSFDTVMTEGKFKYSFAAGMPNITPPYLKTITVQATANTLTNSTTTSAVVLGKRPREVNFTSTSPDIPIMILRDPPGDGSSATIEKGTTVCSGWSLGGSVGAKLTRELNLKLGVEQAINTGVGVEKTTKLKVENTTTLGLTTEFKSNISNEMETCMTATETISTSSGDVILGDDADVYVGGALNLLFGITDDLRYDTANCAFNIHKGLIVFPDRFATTFLYSGYQIKKTIIPNLEFVGDTASANQWRNILQYNEDLKKQAVFEKNFSFDAGVSYQSATSTEITKSFSYGFEVGITASIANQLGIEVDGIGASAKLGLELSLGVNTSFSSKETRTQTVSYSFADDDIKDVFTVDVLRDPVYGTPVFKTVSGNSSCPYEQNTVPRDGVELAVDRTIATNISANEPAVFKFTLGNTSQTDEWRTYTFGIYNSSNPQGARIKIQGNFSNSEQILIAPGQSQEVIVEVWRGPEAFDYEGLNFQIYSPCEGSRYDALGNGDWPPPPFYKEFFLDVHFLEPCSPIDIGFPLENWVLTPVGGNTMFITLNEFQRSDPDLELIRVQYRRAQGDGAWINIVEVPKEDLDNDVFKIVEWNTTGLKDGVYEIRAVTQCIGGQNAGVSTIIVGRIEREAPEIFGTPEPADGVLSNGDEISITFTEPIRCDQIIQADFFNNNNIGLYNAETGKLVDAVITCSGDKITIVPNVPNKFIENTVLRVEVNNIKDLAGNNFEEKKWEFFVDRNPVRWVGGNIDMMKYEGDFVSLKRKLENTGGQALDFDIKEVPAWVRVYPQQGTLAPGVAQDITFEFDSTMVFGVFQDTLFADVALGLEPMVIDARVICPAPEWSVKPSDYTYSMNMSLQLNIEGTLSSDREDCVGAFVNGQCRGLAKVRYQPALKKWMAFLTVYSNDFSGEEVTLQIWDASACLVFGTVAESFTFESEDLIGSPLTPSVVHTNNMVLRKIELSEGWNWISFNLAFPDSTINTVLQSLHHPQNDFVKGQTGFSQYFTEGNQWIGSLPTISNKTMYQYRADLRDTISMLGMPLNLETVTIPVQAGWNWIGYLPQQALPVGTALSSLVPLNGDVIKGQSGFAQYVAGYGWIGNLDYLKAPEGYLLKISNAGTLRYPEESSLVEGQWLEKSNSLDEQPPAVRGLGTHWQANPSKYEHSMTVVGAFYANGENVTGKGVEMAAFSKGEVRGTAESIYIESLDVHLFFLTIYANQAGELLTFKLFDGKEELLLKEIVPFSTDQQLGSVQYPYPFEQPTMPRVSDLLLGRFDVMPNPFTTQTLLRFDAETSGNGRVTVLDVLGAVKGSWPISVNAGQNDYLWEGTTDAGTLSAGVYFIRLEVDGHIRTRKVVLQR